MSKKYSLADLANSLKTSSKIAKELNIDVSAAGIWRKVIISDALGHELTSDDDPLLDAIKDGVGYAYLASHFGKRPQLYLSKNFERKNHIFIMAFFSPYDSSKIVSIWSCEPEVFWEEVDRQISLQAAKEKKTSAATSRLVHFSEAWLRSKKGKGTKLMKSCKLLS